MNGQMYGVILWADKRDQTAVIWCEDHGNLAYYTASDQASHADIHLDAGDLIRFDLREDRDYRSARNLCRVDADFAPDLVINLKRAQANPAPDNTVTPFKAA